jgi:beta-galactosidase
MAPVRRWLKRLGEELAPLQRDAGGPIVAVQLENEYGAFGADKAYLRALRSALEASGFGASPLFTIDQPRDLERGTLDGVPAGITFAPGDPKNEFAAVHEVRSGEPLFCGEYWAGWFDRWGEPRSELDDEQQGRDVQWMLRSGVSLNFYMFAGGTNFGFWNGATGTDLQHYQPVTTSYDYQAALDEAGRPTAKYHRFRAVIMRERTSMPPPVPANPRLIDVPSFALNESVVLSDALGEPVLSPRPMTMEALGQSFGYVLYRTHLRGPRTALLSIGGVRDYAVVSVNGKPFAHLDRHLSQSHLPGTGVPIILAPPAVMSLTVEGPRTRLDILVENGGRINYGPGLGHDRKGITVPVAYDGEELLDWQNYPLPFNDPPAGGFAPGCRAGPAFYRGRFVIEETDDIGDTFLEVRSLRKGALWINGHNAGRFWDIGPQHSLYIPGVWLRRGFNEIIALELFAHDHPPSIHGTTLP